MVTLSLTAAEAVLSGVGVPARTGHTGVAEVDLSGTPGLLRGDAEMNAREREAASALAGTLGGAVRDRLAAVGSGVLAIDGTEAPWELLEDLPIEEHPVGAFRIVRLAPGGSGGLGEGVDVRLWSPSSDEVCAGVAAALGEPLLDPEDRPTVLHVVCHGRETAGRLALVLDEGDQAPDTLGAVLEPVLPGCRVVVLDVCGAGALGETPARRLLAAGAGCVVAPQEPWGSDAALAFSQALYAGLRAGLGVLDAVAAGRRALRVLGVAHPSCRWWNPAIWVSEEAALRPLVEGRAEVDFPLPPAALRHAKASGYLGVEHVLLALSEDEEDPWLAAAGPLLRAIAMEQPRFVAEDWAGPTPRLQRWRAQDLRGLIAEVLRTPWVSLDAVLVGRFHGTDDTQTMTGAAGLEVVEAPGLTLEVQGGPEDGRRVGFRHRGQVLGRWDPGLVEQGIRLYAPPLPPDPTLSRHAAVWEGDAGLRFRGRLLRAGVEEPVDGLVRLVWGDLIRLGAGTTLAVVGI